MATIFFFLKRDYRGKSTKINLSLLFVLNYCSDTFLERKTEPLKSPDWRKTHAPGKLVLIIRRGAGVSLKRVIHELITKKELCLFAFYPLFWRVRLTDGQ